jgi:hypothetical protein
MPMDTRSYFREAPLFGARCCAYCGGVADTRDHAPPRCLLRRPLPACILTVPACVHCNAGSSFHENVFKAILCMTSHQPELIAERQSGGRVDRALARDRRLRDLIHSCLTSDGRCDLTAEALACVDRVLKKTVQGLFFGLYEQFLPADQVNSIIIASQIDVTPEQLVERVRPTPLVDITDEPLPELTPSCWVVREPVIIVDLAPVKGGVPMKRLFRMKRETPIEWVQYQTDTFRFAFVGGEENNAVCVLDFWQTLVAAVAVPWPGRRGPLRRGRKNGTSRERNLGAD